MKALMISSTGQLELKELSIPDIGENEILVHMRACGICGTDLEKVHGESITPPVLGHEVAGEVERAGSDVRTLKEGDRVVVHHHISCRRCYYCKNGRETLCEAYPKSNLDPCGFAEFFRVQETLVDGCTVYKLPESMSFDEGSQVEPTACCIRALRRVGVKAGDSAAVFGVGPAGLTHVQLLELYGIVPVFAIDLLENRRQIAIKLGADLAINPIKEDPGKIILKETSGLGVDHAIVATGNPKAVEQAFSSVRKGGKIILFGAPARGSSFSLDASRLFLHEIGLESSYSTSETEMRMALDLIASGRIKPSLMITHRFPLKQAVEGFKVAETGSETVKVIIQNA